MPIMDVLAAIPWNSRPVTLLVEQVVRGVTGAPTDPVEARLKRMEDLLERQREEMDRVYRAAVPPTPPVQRVAPPAGGPSILGEVVERITLVSGNCKEALRFAREDGMAHPEVQVRLSDAQAQLDALERHTLRPEVLVSLAPDERRAVDALLPEIRRARQGLHNAPDGGPPTVDSLTDAAARLGALGTQARVMEVAVRSGLPVPERPTPAPEKAAAPAPYSRYAPDMSVDTGCLPCGRAHVAGADAILNAAAQEATRKGMADPDVQARVQSAAEELAMVYEHDWTPERIARSPEADRAILEEYAPRFRAVRERLAAARSPEDLADVAADLRKTRQEFMQADQARQQVYTAIRAGGLAASAGDHRLDLQPWVVPYTAVQPSPEEAALETSPPDPEAAYDNLVRALHEARGVRVVYRETPRGEGGIVEAEYDPEANTILMAPFALSKDFYAVQTLAHEAAHALTVNRQCAPEPTQDHAAAEEVAENAALAAMVESNLPIELRNGQVLEPGDRRVDWGALQASLPPRQFAEVRWATDWIVSAIGGQDPATLPAGCAVPVGEGE